LSCLTGRGRLTPLLGGASAPSGTCTPGISIGITDGSAALISGRPKSIPPMSLILLSGSTSSEIPLVSSSLELCMYVIVRDDFVTQN